MGEPRSERTRPHASLVGLTLIVAIWALSLRFSDASAQSKVDTRASFAKEALKLPDTQLRRLEPSPRKTIYSGGGTGYASRPRDDRVGYVVATGVRVLMVGDSMTVGGFGEALQDYLLGRFGTSNVAVFASCGSSPEQWLRSAPSFITRCGYREQTPHSSILCESQNGKEAAAISTPKLEDLVASFQPTTVIVQLGTNWMDGMGFESAMSQSTYGKILDRFVVAVHSGPNTVHRIIWITPPDSSHYSEEVKSSVTNLIKAAAKRDSFMTIDSNSMTHYVSGKSGSDGVHYNSEEAKEWASRVVKELERMWW